jgi:hypothetical protein
MQSGSIRASPRFRGRAGRGQTALDPFGNVLIDLSA